MMQVETSVLIRRPIEAVFNFVGDARNSAKWHIGICPNTLETATRTRSKTRRRRRRAAAAPPVVKPSEVTLFEPDRQLGIKTFRGPFEFDAVYHFEPRDDATTITWTCRVLAGHGYGSAEPLVGQVVAAETQVNLLILKALLEGIPEPESKPA